MSITPASPSDPKTSAPSLRPGEQILQSIYPGRCSHTLHLTLRNSNIASLSPWFTQPVHQAGIFLLKNFFLSFFFFYHCHCCFNGKYNADTSKCAHKIQSSWHAVMYRQQEAWKGFLQTFIQADWSNSNTSVFIAMTWGRSGSCMETCA